MRFGELDRLVAKLAPDEAILVPETRGGADGALAVNRLRSSLRTRFWGRALTFIQDHDKVGVWVYRPASRAIENSPAIGPAKEDEIRSRPLEG